MSVVSDLVDFTNQQNLSSAMCHLRIQISVANFPPKLHFVNIYIYIYTENINLFTFFRLLYLPTKSISPAMCLLGYKFYSIFFTLLFGVLDFSTLRDPHQFCAIQMFLLLLLKLLRYFCVKAHFYHKTFTFKL